MSLVASPYVSRVAVFDLEERSTRIVFERKGIVEAPNWSRDGKRLLVNADGHLWTLALDVTSPTLERIPLGQGGYVCNNDHDLSPDGTRLAFSASSPASKGSQVFVADADGGAVTLVTPRAPSYFHGWSPDGRWLVFVAERGDGNFEIYRVPSAGGQEERLTCTGGYDDGPEYDPSGRYIYFNSNRGGRWNLWRMPALGAGPADCHAEQITDDAPEDWFPHLSPDGRWLVCVAFPPGTVGHDERMAGMALRLLPAPGVELGRLTSPQTVAEFFGGQGSLNVNSWSADSRHFAYVIYQPAE